MERNAVLWRGSGTGRWLKLIGIVNKYMYSVFVWAIWRKLKGVIILCKGLIIF